LSASNESCGLVGWLVVFKLWKDDYEHHALSFNLRH